MKSLLRKCLDTALWPELVASTILVVLILALLAWLSTIF